METKKRLNYKSVLHAIIQNGYSHIRAINNEIHKLGVKDPLTAPEEVQNQLRALTMTLTLINDLIHPAHKISKSMLMKCEHPIIDYCINAQKIAVESKLVEICYCDFCKEDKDESQS